MAVGGVAVRVTAEALSSGSVRLKHSTAEQFLGHETLRDSTETSTDGPQALVLYPCPAQGFASPLYAQLRIVPTRARQGQSLGASPPPPPPPSLQCEMCGLGAWLRGQGAVPGVQWVQLWRGAGGALRLRLCDGKPTALPREDAADVRQQQQGVAVANHHTAASEGTGASDAPAAQAAAVKAAAADAAAKLVGPAAQAVADAAAPWQLRAPTCRAPCMPAVAALQVPATSCQLGAAGAGAGADGVGSAEGHPPNCDRRGPLPMGQWRTSGGGSSELVASQGAAGSDWGGADRHGLVDAAPAHPRRDGGTGGASHWLSLSQPPMPPPQPLAVPVPQPSPPLLSPPPPPPTLLARVASQLAAKAGRPATMSAHGAPELETAAGFGYAAQSEEQQPGKQQQQQQQQVQHEQQVEGGVAVPGRPSSTGILTGRVSNYKIVLRAEGAQGLLALSLLREQGPQSRPDWITVHVEEAVEEAGGGHSRHEGAHQGQQQGSEFAVRLLCAQEGGRYNRWYLSCVAALLKALRAADGDTVQLQYESDGRLMIWRAARQPQQQQAAGAVPLAACPADSILVGYRYGSHMHARVGAVRALWPDLASQLACGQSAEVEVHPAVADAGGQALGPFTLTLKLRTSKGKTPSWRLNDCGLLFRALGAQERDAVFMRRSPGDGRLVAGVQPRGGVHRDREARLGQQQGQEQEAEQQQGQGQQGEGRRRQPRRRARQGGLHRLYGDYVVQEASDVGDGEPSDDGDGGVERWMSGESEEEGREEGPPGPPGEGLSRPSKRARAAEGAAQQYGGASATQRMQLVQLTASPAGSTLVGYKDRAQVDVRPAAVSALWPEVARQLACGQSVEVELQAALAGAGAEAPGPFTVTLKLYAWRSKPTAWRLNGCGGLFRALGAQDGDAIHMWRSPGDGRVVAGVQPRGGVRGDRREARLGQQQGQEQEAEQQQGQGQGQQGEGRCRQPRRRARQGGLHRLYGDYVVQEPTGGEDGEEDDGDGGVEKGDSGGSEEWQEEGPRGPPGDGLWRPTKRARATGGAAQQYGGPSATQQQQQAQQVQLTACPAGSILVGYKYRTQVDVRAAAVHTLWPDLVSQLVCGQSAEVEVHPAVAEAGGEALGPCRAVLKQHTWRARARLSSCGPLFRALGAQDRDAIFMWRSPGDGRMMAGVQPRGGVRGYVQVAQRGAGPGRAGEKVRQVYDEYDVHESTDECEELEEGSGGYWEEEEEEEDGEEKLEEEGFGGEASFAAGREGKGQAGQGCGVLGGGGGAGGWEGAGLGCGGDNGAGVGGEDGEETEEEEDHGVNWWAREVGGEVGFGEDSDGG